MKTLKDHFFGLLLKFPLGAGCGLGTFGLSVALVRELSEDRRDFLGLTDWEGNFSRLREEPADSANATPVLRVPQVPEAFELSPRVERGLKREQDLDKRLPKEVLSRLSKLPKTL